MAYKKPLRQSGPYSSSVQTEGNLLHRIEKRKPQLFGHIIRMDCSMKLKVMVQVCVVDGDNVRGRPPRASGYT